MSEKKIPHSSAADGPEPPNHCPVDWSANMNEAGQRNGDAASSSPESGSVNGDGKRSGKSRRRRKRSSNPESHTEGKVDENGKLPEPRTVLMGLQAERAHVWLERSTYERAESRYQRWLATAPRKQPPSSVAAWCHHEEQVVQEVWVNKWTFDQAERGFIEDSAQTCVPNSLELASPADGSIAPTAPDEGYQSLAPTPAAPVVPPTSRQSANGLPRFPVELLRDVWLEKLLYDRAEAAFYQNLYGNNSSKRCGSRGSDHPQCLVEEEEEDEEELVGGETRPLQLCKAEVFHALHPIQEEEEPAEDASGLGLRYFLHPDSERVWLDRCRYDAAESSFQRHRGAKRSPRPEADAASLRDNTMSAADFLAQEKIWFDKPRYDEAERRFYEHMNGGARPTHTPKDVGANTILQDIARARENIQKSLAGLKTTLCSRGSDQPPPSPQLQLSSSSNNGGGAADQGELVSRIQSLELENQSLHKVVEDLRAALSKLECRVAVLEKPPAAVAPAPVASVPYTNGTTVQQTSSSPAEEEDDDDFDLFGSDDDEEAEKLKEQRLKAYAEKKAKKPVLVAKSSILLDVKPWDDETDMVKLEECVRSVQADGLLWGTSKLVPVGYGIKKLQIACVVEDDKVGTDMLEEEITKFEDYVQSVDVAAFNKI